MSPKKTPSKNNTSTVLRNIVDAREVVKAQVASTIVEELLAKEMISIEECKDLIQKVQSVVELQSNNLIDRVQKLL